MITWDKNKNKWLQKVRGVSFEEIKDIIESNDDIEIIGNPNYQDQNFFIIFMKEYTYVVPFEMDSEENIILKTAYPSRKYNKKYRV